MRFFSSVRRGTGWIQPGITLFHESHAAIGDCFYSWFTHWFVVMVAREMGMFQTCAMRNNVGSLPTPIHEHCANDHSSCTRRMDDAEEVLIVPGNHVAGVIWVRSSVSIHTKMRCLATSGVTPPADLPLQPISPLIPV